MNDQPESTDTPTADPPPVAPDTATEAEPAAPATETPADNPPQIPPGPEAPPAPPPSPPEEAAPAPQTATPNPDTSVAPPPPQPVAPVEQPPAPPPSEPPPAAVAPEPSTAGVQNISAAVLALSDDELRQAASLYLKRHQADFSKRGVAARQQKMQHNLDRIEAYIKQHGSAQIPRLTQEFNLSPVVTSKYMQQLVAQGRVKASGHGVSRRYSAS